MSIKNHHIPNDSTFVKLKDYPDGEEIKVIGAGITDEGQYGDQAYFINDSEERVMLPTRYVNYVKEILDDPEAVKEIEAGMVIVKNSRKAQNGSTTPTFEFK